MRFLLVAGGILSDAAALHRQTDLTSYDFILAVDRGFDHCRSLGIVPHLLMGDLDSVRDAQDPSICLCEVIRFAPEKDETDLRLALDYALQHGAQCIDIICATGGRLDHLLGNLSLLEYAQEQAPALPVRMIDESNVIRALSQQAGCQQFAAHSKYLSVVPISAEICFSAEGLKYPAQQLRVQRSNMVSISNECLGTAFSLTLHSGKALLIEALGEEVY